MKKFLILVLAGLGLGSLLSGSDIVTDRMIAAAADAVARNVTDDELEAGMLYPTVARLREVCRRVAAAVIHAAGDEGVGDSLSREDVASRLADAIWQPEYRPYVSD